MVAHKSHDYRQLLPLKNGLLKCRLCGIVTPIFYISNNSNSCIVQMSSRMSGYLDKSREILLDSSRSIAVVSGIRV